MPDTYIYILDSEAWTGTERTKFMHPYVQLHARRVVVDNMPRCWESVNLHWRSRCSADQNLSPESL